LIVIAIFETVIFMVSGMILYHTKTDFKIKFYVF
jgi:hypothetical protein